MTPTETPKRYGHPGFYELLEHMADVHSRKNHDYAGEGDPLANFRLSLLCGVEPWVGAFVRITDKWSRIANFIKQGTLKVSSETVEDTLLDLSVYSLLAILLYRERAETATGPRQSEPPPPMPPPSVGAPPDSKAAREQLPPSDLYHYVPGVVLPANPSDPRAYIRVYVGGPLSAPTVDYLKNVHRMYKAVTLLHHLGFSTYNPSEDFLLGIMRGDMGYEDYFRLNQPWLLQADAMWVTEESPGTLREIKLCTDNGIRVFYERNGLKPIVGWARDLLRARQRILAAIDKGKGADDER